MNIILAFVILLVAITLHEFGHFIFGKIMGVRVYEFAIGFGPKLFGWKRKSTKYSVRLLPLGGYCSFDDPEEEIDSTVEFEPDDGLIKYEKASPWKRLFILSGGIIFNLLTAIILLWGIFSFNGIRTTKVDEVIANSPAAYAGIKAEDEIIKIDDLKVETAADFMNSKAYTSGKYNITINRDGVYENIDIVSDSEGKLGVVFGSSKNIGLALKYSFVTIWDIISQIIGIFLKIFYNVDKNIMGVVGFVATVGGMESLTLTMVLTMIASLSISLACFNILPIPPLDGGAMLLTIIEIIIGRPLSDKFRSIFQIVGIAFMMYLFVRVLINDFLRL